MKEYEYYSQKTCSMNTNMNIIIICVLFENTFGEFGVKRIIFFSWFSTNTNNIQHHSLLKIHSPPPLLRLRTRIMYMLKQLFSRSLMKVMKPWCPKNVESEETSLSWLYPRSIGPQCKTSWTPFFRPIF